MDPHEIHERLVAAGIPGLVDVELPPATYARINGMLNSVLVSPVPGWIMKLYAAQDGLTACYYHCRNVERIELGVDAIARRAYGTTPSDAGDQYELRCADTDVRVSGVLVRAPS